LLIVMVGWAIFRSPSMAHLGGHLASLVDWSGTDWPADMPSDVVLTCGLGSALCLLPAAPLYGALQRAHARGPAVRRFAAGMLVALFVVAVARASAATFKPFIYFRF
jgi:alginate O-acetyltransferase complex protein AlgI